MAIKHTYQHTFNTAHGEQSNWFAKMHAAAIMSWVAVQELYPLQLHLSIKIGDEITPQALRAYHQHLHLKVFPPNRKSTVKELVADGHQKVHIKCANSRQHAGKPPSHGRIKPFGHGWFMLVHPRDLRILAVKSMCVPENNAILHDSLLEILPLYKNLDGVIMDRACGFLPTAQADKNLKQIKYWSIDGFHARGGGQMTSSHGRQVRSLVFQRQRIFRIPITGFGGKKWMHIRYMVYAMLPGKSPGSTSKQLHAEVRAATEIPYADAGSWCDNQAQADLNIVRRGQEGTITGWLQTASYDDEDCNGGLTSDGSFWVQWENLDPRPRAARYDQLVSKVPGESLWGPSSVNGLWCNRQGHLWIRPDTVDTDSCRYCEDGTAGRLESFKHCENNDDDNSKQLISAADAKESHWEPFIDDAAQEGNRLALTPACLVKSFEEVRWMDMADEVGVIRVRLRGADQLEVQICAKDDVEWTESRALQRHLHSESPAVVLTEVGEQGTAPQEEGDSVAGIEPWADLEPFQELLGRCETDSAVFRGFGFGVGATFYLALAHLQAVDKEVAKTVVDITGLQLSTSYQANCCRKWVGLVQVEVTFVKGTCTSYPGLEVEVLYCHPVKTIQFTTVSKVWYFQQDDGTQEPYGLEDQVTCNQGYTVDFKVFRRLPSLALDAPNAELLLAREVSRYGKLASLRDDARRVETAEYMALLARSAEEKAGLIAVRLEEVLLSSMPSFSSAIEQAATQSFSQLQDELRDSVEPAGCDEKQLLRRRDDSRRELCAALDDGAAKIEELHDFLRKATFLLQDACLPRDPVRLNDKCRNRRRENQQPSWEDSFLAQMKESLEKLLPFSLGSAATSSFASGGLFSSGSFVGTQQLGDASSWKKNPSSETMGGTRLRHATPMAAIDVVLASAPTSDAGQSHPISFSLVSAISKQALELRACRRELARFEAKEAEEEGAWAAWGSGPPGPSYSFAAITGAFKSVMLELRKGVHLSFEVFRLPFLWEAVSAARADLVVLAELWTRFAPARPGTEPNTGPDEGGTRICVKLIWAYLGPYPARRYRLEDALSQARDTHAENVDEVETLQRRLSGARTSGDAEAETCSAQLAEVSARISQSRLAVQAAERAAREELPKTAPWGLPELQLDDVAAELMDIVEVLTPGRKCSDYEELQPLPGAGRGGVFTARYDGQECVLKEIRSMSSSGALKREVLHRKRLDHPLIVPVLAAFEEEDKGRAIAFLHMPKYACNLEQWCSSEHFTLAKTRLVLRDLLLAVAFVHSKNVIHGAARRRVYVSLPAAPDCTYEA
ncbi:hypothetical protein AK812_SmicGene2621 [Symbiodinium microadriaticum]|uniref:Protein kinase domain-containing protein n=1 Tax=Symbiodinium microadriaticum TaxID=2951 RepID=A0A1Q9F106_SYMMI|nr:hypothetical protein AK812_SmicGene2621 [Symbiodinium microadriaticum]